MTLLIRPLTDADRPAWDVLWAGYLEFYETELAPEVTELTWRRFADPAEPMWALGAFDDGELVGLCHHHLHRSTWATTTYCYLEDLYTAPAARGRGVGRALIEATATAARAEGAEQIHWQTMEHNATARALYDQVARHNGYIVYERDLI